MKILLSAWCLIEGNSIDADSGPLGYVLWWCGSRSWEECIVFLEDSVKFEVLVLFVKPFDNSTEQNSMT